MSRQAIVLFLIIGIVGQLGPHAAGAPLMSDEDSAKETADSAKETADSAKEAIDSTKETVDSTKETVDSVEEAVDSNKLVEESKEESEVDWSKDFIDLSYYGSALFGLPDLGLTADLVANYTPDSSSVNPEELGSYLEGDILIPQKPTVFKNGIVTQSSRWPNGIIPYEIRGGFTAADMNIIERAINEYHKHTCIRFVPRTNQHDYVSIVAGKSGCWSSVGRVGGRQEVNLQSPGCLTKAGTPIHELMHAVGFLHEQNREERDSYVAIQYQNIQPGASSNFNRASRTLSFGVPYDYGSVMHYSANAFSINGRPTIVPLQPIGNTMMGQRDGFSVRDIQKINRMYDCSRGGGSMTIPQPAPLVPVPMPAPIPAPKPIPGPMPAPAVGNNIIGSFLGGLITGLGLAEENA